MHERWISKGDVGISRLLWLFAILSVVLLVLLAAAPARSRMSEWRSVQARYDHVAAAQGAAKLDPGIQQIWKPQLGVVDRCTTCHVGMGAAQPVPGSALFAEHPPVPHDPADLGCTICHGGQGRATGQAAAHGHARHWDDPMLEKPYVEAGCGACHSRLRVPSASLAERGEALFRRHDCTACHRVDGTGRGSGPDLSHVGIKGFAPDWPARHEARKKRDPSPAWRDSWEELGPGDVLAVDEYLRSRFGAPKLLEAKALAHRLGCRGCHKINGVGGDDGPDLSNEGRKVAADLDYAGVRGPRALAGWLEEHFLDPARVVPGSQMPDLGLTVEQARTLTLYMLSLRQLDIPQAQWPVDRVRGERLGEREHATDGETLFGAYCSGCHGPRGEGRRFAGSAIGFPAIGNEDFLAVAGDEYLRKTVALGRPGRRMPAWGQKDAGLRPEEIEAVVSYLRSLGPGTPETEQPVAPGDAARGAGIYLGICSGCHGPRGEGAEGPALSNPAFLEAASDAYLAATVTRGRTGTSMRAFARPMLGFPALDKSDIADVVAFVRAFAGSPETRDRKGTP
jgi:mono/diheme cytochrome c family protein